MKIRHFEQGTEAWHQWRRTHAMASYAPAMMGMGKYTPHNRMELWEVYTGRRVIPETEPMRHGRKYEPRARALLEREKGVAFSPLCVEHDDGLLAASLDGITFDGTVIAEIKCPYTASSPIYKAMRGKEVAAHCVPQVQQQLLVSGANRAVFCVYNHRTDSIEWVTVYRDERMMEAIYAGWRDFWPYVARDEPPVAEQGEDWDADWAEDWAAAAMAWRMADARLREAKALERRARNALIDLSGFVEREGCGVRVQPVRQKGRVQYNKIPELHGLDLDAYRAEGTTAWRLTDTTGGGKGEGEKT